jgi:hypothetical protein
VKPDDVLVVDSLLRLTAMTNVEIEHAEAAIHWRQVHTSKTVNSAGHSLHAAFRGPGLQLSEGRPDIARLMLHDFFERLKRLRHPALPE